jgi:tripeptide aminopeptidase
MKNLKIDETRLIDTFTRLVEIDSPSLDERRVCDFILKELRSIGIAAQEDGAAKKIGGTAGNLFFKVRGKSDVPSVMFCVHTDTVEPSHGKRAVKRGDGRITSAGDTVLGADDLTGVAAILEAFRIVKENDLKIRTTEAVFMAAEEIYGSGAGAFDYSVLESKDCYVLDLSGRVGTAAYAAPTILAFNAEFHGKAAHAGFAFDEGRHAVQAAAAAVAAFPLGNADGSTCNVGLIEGGRATNIVPDLCVVKGEIRSLNHESATARAEALKRVYAAAAAAHGVSLEFKTRVCIEAYETPLDSAVARRFERVCGETGIPCRFVATLGGSDNNIIVKNGIDGLVVASAMNDCHSTAEYTEIKEIVKLTELILRIMLCEC